MMKKQILAFSAALLATALAAHAQTVHDGGGKLLLTASMIHSGSDANHVNVYQNYLVRATLKVANVSNVTITQCDIGGFADNGIDLNSITNVSVINNRFHDLPTGTGIGAAPTNIINCHFDGNAFAAAPHGVQEPIHLFFGYSSQSANDTVSNNAILGYSRIGIELQQVVHGLKVLNNYVAGRAPLLPNQGGDMAISCATGGTVPGAADTTGVEIAHNTLIGTNPLAFGYVAAIESMGSGNNIHDNYLKYWGNGIIYGLTVESGNVPWHITNNTLVGVNNLAGDEGFGNGSAPVLSGNVSYAANDSKAPAPPTAAETIGGSSTTAPTTQRSGTQQPGDSTITATAAVDGVHIALPGTPGILTWTATGGGDKPLPRPSASQTHSVAIAAGITSYVDQTVPNDWKVWVAFSGSAGGVLLTSNAAQVFTRPITQPTTVTSSPQPATQPSPVVSADLAAVQAAIDRLSHDLAAGN